MSDFKDRQINKKKKFVADGVFNAEVHEFLSKALEKHGYGGVTIKASQAVTRICPKVVTSQDDKVSDREVNEIQKLLEKRFGFETGKLKIVLEPISNRGLSASAQAENLKQQLLEGLSVRYCAMRTINTVMRSGGADGCEVMISGKLRQQRAKAMKYKKGYIVSTGHPKTVFVDDAIRHVFLKQGVIGVRVKVMLPHNTGDDGKKGGKHRGGRRRPQGGLPFPLPDKIKIEPPKEDNEPDFLPGGAQADQQEGETPVEEENPIQE